MTTFVPEASPFSQADTRAGSPTPYDSNKWRDCTIDKHLKPALKQYNIPFKSNDNKETLIHLLETHNYIWSNDKWQPGLKEPESQQPNTQGGQQPDTQGGQQPDTQGQQPNTQGGQQPDTQGGQQPDTQGQQPNTQGGQQPDAESQQPNTQGGQQPDTQGGQQPDTQGQQPNTQGGQQPDAQGQQPNTQGGQQPDAESQGQQRNEPSNNGAKVRTLKSKFFGTIVSSRGKTSLNQHDIDFLDDAFIQSRLRNFVVTAADDRETVLKLLRDAKRGEGEHKFPDFVFYLDRLLEEHEDWAGLASTFLENYPESWIQWDFDIATHPTAKLDNEVEYLAMLEIWKAMLAPRNPHVMEFDEDYDSWEQRKARRKLRGTCDDPRANIMTIRDPDRPRETIEVDIIGVHPRRMRWLIVAARGLRDENKGFDRGFCIGSKTTPGVRQAVRRFNDKGDHHTIGVGTVEMLQGCALNDFEINFVFEEPWGDKYRTYAYGGPKHKHDGEEKKEKTDFCMWSRSTLRGVYGEDSDVALEVWLDKAGQEMRGDWGILDL